MSWPFIVSFLVIGTDVSQIGSISRIEDETKGLGWMVKAVPHHFMTLVRFAIFQWEGSRLGERR